jgi:hypothetical protein
VDAQVGNGEKKTVFESHLKIGRLSREADGKYSMTTTTSAQVVTDQSDASAFATPHAC